MSVPAINERRNSLRLDKVFPVQVESPVFGYSNCIARNISPGGIFLESRELLPLGSAVKVIFSLPDNSGGITAVGEVKNHYLLQFGGNDEANSVTGMGVRFTQFEDDGLDRLSETLGSTMPMQ